MALPISPGVFMTLPAEPCHSGGLFIVGGVFIVAQVYKTKWCRNLIPAYFRSRALEVGHDVAHDLLWSLVTAMACVMYQSLQKYRQKPNPNDFTSRALSVGPDMFKDSPWRAWSQRLCVYGDKIDPQMTGKT